ncbi:MAG: hypothetical protein VX560_09475 [SAR324 cluster bacterium]|nr:hypothetical protein [SAR324 cluster bacterium]
MKIIKTLQALLKLLNRFKFPDVLVLTVCFVGLLTISPSMALTQEYETDRIFIRQQSKNHCLVNVRDQIREHRKTRDMSDEHNQLINRHVWNRNRTGLEMSQNQQQRLNQLLKGNPGPKYLSARQLMQKRERMYAKMKQNCKDLASQ